MRNTDITDRPANLECKTKGYEVTRFNALKHGVLSHDTVLPWENESEYDALLDALIAEHQPQGPTDEHLVEELAGIIWRKRRLRLAEAAAHRRGLDSIAARRDTVAVHYRILLPVNQLSGPVMPFRRHPPRPVRT